jgi:hypothetical protein
MKILGNSITERLWRKHLFMYSPSLFENFSKLTSILMPDVTFITPHSLYICPLCLRSYFTELQNGVSGNSEFSLEHIPPKSVGGNFKLITCKKCNNKSGEYEAELLKLLEFGSVPDKKYNSILPKLTVQRKGSNEALKGSVQSKDGVTNVFFNANEKEHNPILQNFLRELHEGRIVKVTVKVPMLDLKKIQKALLKSAYLICFAWWGYDFVCSKNGGMIRQVLNDEIDYPTIVPTIWLDTNRDSLPESVGILIKHEKKEAFVVTMRIKNGAQNCTATILIPNPTESGWENLRELDEFMKNNGEEVKVIILPISVPVVTNGYWRAWNMFQ